MLEGPVGWRELWTKAQEESDPRKLKHLIDRLNQLCSEYEKAQSSNVVWQVDCDVAPRTAD